MPITFPTFEECTVNNGKKFLVYAPAGHGKTVLCATLPEPILMVTTENGMLSLSPANQMRIFGRVADITPVRVATIKDLYDLVNLLDTSADYAHFASVALDSITDIAEVVLTAALGRNADGRKAYGEMGEQVTKAFRKFRDLKKQNVLFLAHQDREKEESTGLMLYGPAMPGTKLGQKVAHFFDEVFHLAVIQNDKTKYRERWLLCQPDGIKFSAKDRSGALDEYEPANLTEVINKIQAHER